MISMRYRVKTDEPKTYVLGYRVSADEHARVKREAIKLKMSISRYIELCVSKGARR